ncbi:MAG: site-specific integrase [Rikenellaceae bacterium]
MTNTKRNTFKVLFLIRRSKLLKNGEAPICMRLTVNGGIVEMMIKRSVPPAQWSQAKERSRGTNATAKELNYYLDTIKARILKIQQEMEAEDAVINARTVRDRYNGVGCEDKTKTILEVYQEHNDKCEALIGIDYSKSTVEKFGTSIKCLKEYIQHQYSRDDLYLKEVDFTFVQNFEFYLKTVRNCKHNSALKHLKNLKKVIKIAIANEWMKRDPFIGMQFKYTETNTEFLTQEELTTLMSKDFGVERLNLVRDVFSFCALTGLAYVDVSQLTPDHIVKDNSGALWIRKPRQKTGNMCNIPLLSPAVALIEKYATHPECIKRGTVLPVYSNQKQNAYLKEIATICGIRKKLSTNVARYTCATVVMLANNVSMENVAKILGHSTTKMTQLYAKVLDSSIMRDVANVEKNFIPAISNN